MTTYNLDKMVKVECYGAMIDETREYRKALKIFGITIRPAGIYSTILTDCFIASDISENEFYENGEIYDKPSVTAYFTDDIRLKRYFDTYEEAVKFYNVLTRSGRWVTVDARDKMI